MATINVILQAKARDRGVHDWLRGAIKLADQLTASMGRASAAMGSMGRGSLGSISAAGSKGGRARGAAGRATSDGGGASGFDKSLREAQRARERAWRLEAKSAERNVSAIARAGQQRAKASQRAARNLQNLSDAQLQEIETQREITARRKRAARSAAKASLGADPTAAKMGPFGKLEFAENLAVAGGEFEQFGNKVESGIRGSFDAFKDYEKAVVEVSTLTDNIPIDQIQQITKDAAEQFGGLPTDQVKGFYSIVSAGATSAADAQAQLNFANKLAIGGVATQEEAVLAISKSVANFKDQGVDAAQAADSLFTAVQRGQTTVEEMARALPNVASAAAASGLSLDETNAALAVLSTRLPNAKEAATSLKAAFSNLQKPTKGARREAKRLGIDFSVAGVEAAGGIEEFLVKLRAAEKFDENTLAKLFDSSEARAAISNLISGMDDYRSVLSDMERKQGAADRAYAKMADTAAQKSKQLEAQWELLKIQAGEQLLPALLGLAESVKPIINDVKEWIGANPALAASLAKLAVTTALVAKGTSAAISAFSMWQTMSGLTQLSNDGLSKSATSASVAITNQGTAMQKTSKAAGVMRSAVGALPAVFIGAQAAIFAFNLVLDKAQQPLSEFEETLKGIEERQKNIKFFTEATEQQKERMAYLEAQLAQAKDFSIEKQNIKAEIEKLKTEMAPRAKTDEEILLEQRQRLVETANAARKTERVAGGGEAWNELMGGNPGEAFGQAFGGILNVVSRTQEDFELQRAQAERDLAAFDRQYGQQLNLGTEAFTAEPQTEGGLLSGPAALAERMEKLIAVTERVAANTTTTNGPSMEAG